MKWGKLDRTFTFNFNSTKLHHPSASNPFLNVIGSIGEAFSLLTSDWFTPQATAIILVRPFGVCNRGGSIPARRKMASWCVRAVRQSYSLVASPALIRASPRLLCTATQQKNGPRSEEEAEKPEQSTAEKALTEEKTQLEEQLKDMTDKYKRALADTENLRTRSQKMVEDAKLYGIQGFCKDLLEVADILEKATESVPKEEVTAQNPHLKNLYDGLVMTEVQIQKVFTKHGLVKLNPDGEKFNPYEHEALFHAPMEGKEPGSVAVVTKVGYKLHGRTLRPALVGVAKAP
ncbi:hypothetical protein L3Q82_017065 [Scortum barcoo]|uniref:Uncharacterized protein n=1 Tax=Scortum barcoo TaxID=214431 RepID=A0ACB8X8I5_9TELE|nr:hypothetical protein L3Q82_017065 [Scortum barcoo]